MANTHGFEVVVELAEAALRKFLRGAWKSAECPGGDEGRIPEFLDIPEDTGDLEFDGYKVADGQIQIPEDELDASMATDVNGAELKLGLHIQLDIEDPPVPSAGFFDMTADVRAKAPIGTLPDSNNVGFLLEGLPRANVTTSLTSGDPLAPKLDTLLTEFVHQAYEDGTIPHSDSRQDIEWPLPLGATATVDADTEVYDDSSDPAHRIEVSRSGAPPNEKIEISLPIYLKIYNIRLSTTLISLKDPMGIETRLILSAPFDSPPGSYTARLSEATVTVQQPLTPAPGIEGQNYQDNTSIPIVGPLIESAIVSELKNQGQQMAQDIGDFTIEVPTVAEIEEAIGDLFHEQLESREFISIWTPEAAGDELEVDNIATKALSDALVIAINAGSGANIDAMTNFIPADREFAIALDGAKVQEIINVTRAENGFADWEGPPPPGRTDGSDLPKRFDADGDDVDLNELDVFLINGAIRMTGEVTVIDAILGSIDVDADFRVDVGLRWNPNGALNAAGGQMMEHFIIDEDVDPEESVLLWVITAILAVLTLGAFGLIAAIIVVVIGLIVRAIVESIGSDMLVDGVSGAIEGITAWPSELAKIGRVQSVFHDPISIDTSGLVIAGTVEVISDCEATAVVGADSGSTYSVNAASSLTLAAQETHGDASYKWLAGDGSVEVATQNKFHTYAASGLYIAKHALTINQFGGATSRHFALVDVKNMPPTVDAGLDLTVNEGEVVTLVGKFWDVEYPDTHESSWNFGDNQGIKAGTIQETNNPPQAVGTSTVQHAWCDNGEYTVTLRVRDQNGGIGTDTRKVTVLNVPPEVDAGPPMYAYPCTVLTLTGQFTDPGWCDTHVGSWEFGDCTPPQTAIIRETNDPPAAEGVAIASHIYKACGTYHVICTVVDDDGGVGQDTTVVRVVDVENKDFEGGYRGRMLGSVANAWEPYTAALQTFPPSSGAAGTSSAQPPPERSTQIFSCEECCVHDGQRSQRMKLDRSVRAGIYQQIGANPEWDYQVSVWYFLDEVQNGTARLGIDPEGGTEPDSPSIVWNEGTERQQWAQLSERVAATGDVITIFLEAAGQEKGGTDACFDDVALIPIQPHCPPEEEPEPEKPRPERPKPREVCVNFTDLQPYTEVPAVYAKEGFTFSALDNQPQKIVTWGVPTGQNKLELRAAGIFVDLPFTADYVKVRASHYSKPVQVIALDSNGNAVGQATAPPIQDVLHTLEIAAPGIVRLRVMGGGGEALLFEVCARRDWRTDENKRPKPNLSANLVQAQLPQARLVAQTQLVQGQSDNDS